jgi:hypothetical protein
MNRYRPENALCTEKLELVVPNLWVVRGFGEVRPREKINFDVKFGLNIPFYLNVIIYSISSTQNC